jgi:flagellar hook protein FlgE
MGSALWSGISGLNASSKQMDVIANNVANVNTIGYKAGKTFFADVLSQSISGGSSGSMQVGRGVEVTEVGTLFSPGSFETTGNATDLAIDGDGFFMVNDEDAATFYTRAGAFHLDSNGNLVDTNGYKLQGYNFFGAATGMITDISLRNVQSAPETTTEYSVGVNLNSETAATDMYTTTQTVYDSLGDRHSLGITFTKTATNGEWDFQVALDGVNATCPYTGLQFDSDGNLANIYDGAGWVVPGDMSVTFAALSNGATIGTGNVVNWDLTGTSALSITQYASASVIKSLTNDGYASGLLKSLSVRNDGTINGFFTNGQTSDLAQLVLGDFDNTWGLKKMGSNLFAETVTSGPAIRNVPGASGMGDVSSNSLEMSNSDLATEFVNMITAQKAYSANARVITTQDQMMTELMNIKR